MVSRIFSVRLPHDAAEKIDTLANARGISSGLVIKAVVDDYLGERQRLDLLERVNAAMQAGERRDQSLILTMSRIERQLAVIERTLQVVMGD